MKQSHTKNLVLTAFCIALCIVLPMAFHAIGAGATFLPMHIPVLLCGLLFTVIQPIAVYRKAQKQASGITADTSVGFDDEGVHVGVGDKNSVLKWSNVKKISRKPTMIVIFSDTTHGFVLSNRVLGADREAFYNYVASKMKK